MVANHVAALPGHALAAAAATVAAALRRLDLNGQAPGADVLRQLPERVRTQLPTCFRRDTLQDPAAMAGMAAELFERSSSESGAIWLALVEPTATLARQAASLMYDPLQAATLELTAVDFHALSERAEGLKKGGNCAKLAKQAPDAHYRRKWLLPQLERAFRYHGCMADRLCAAIDLARLQLHQQRQWPMPPEPTSSRPATRGSYEPQRA